MANNNLSGGQQCSPISNELLNLLINHGNLEALEKVQQEIMRKQERDKCLAMHTNKISLGKDGVWRTRIKTPSGLKLIAKARREDLDDCLVEHYKNMLEKKTFCQVFNEWIDEKNEFNEVKQSSITRYKTSFKKFFTDDPFCSLTMDKITNADLELFIKRAIKKHNLTKKSYANLVILLNGVFKYAKREEYTTFSITNFFGDLALPDHMFARKKRRKDEDEVFSQEEAELLIEYLWDNVNIQNLGLILMFQTGMRVGELTALTKSCVNLDNLTIDITSTEVSYDDENGKRIFSVQDDTKTDNGSRTIFLPLQAEDTIKKIFELNPDGKYLMTRDGSRIRSKSINYYLAKACKNVGIPVRTSHKIRKTYASTLILNNVDEKLIQNQLGHTDISTTRKYYNFNTVRNKNVIRDKISNAISF